MIYMEERHLKIVREILSPYPYKFCVFGSRVRPTHNQYSDLDLCAMDDIPDVTKSCINEAFEESNLPFKVDIIEWNKISTDFQMLIKNSLIPLISFYTETS